MVDQFMKTEQYIRKLLFETKFLSTFIMDSTMIDDDSHQFHNVHLCELYHPPSYFY